MLSPPPPRTCPFRATAALGPWLVRVREHDGLEGGVGALEVVVDHDVVEEAWPLGVRDLVLCAAHPQPHLRPGETGSPRVESEARGREGLAGLGSGLGPAPCPPSLFRGRVASSRGRRGWEGR